MAARLIVMSGLWPEGLPHDTARRASLQVRTFALLKAGRKTGFHALEICLQVRRGACLTVVRDAHQACADCTASALRLARRTLVAWGARKLDAACVVAVQSRSGLGFVSRLGVFPYRVCPDCPRRTRGAMLRPCLVRKASRRDSSGPPKAGRFLWCEPLTHPVSALPGSALIGQHIARLRRLPRPVREREDPQRHEVHQR